MLLKLGIFTSLNTFFTVLNYANSDFLQGQILGVALGEGIYCCSD